GQLRLTGGAFLVQRLEARDDHPQKLDDDARSDIGHDAQSEDRQLQQRAAAEEVDHRESALIELGRSHAFLHLGVIDAGRGNEGAESEDDKNAQGEEEFVPQVGRSDGPPDCADQASSSLANETNTSKTLSGYDPQVETDEGRRRLGSGRPPGTAGRGRVTQKGAVTEVTAPFVLKPRSRSAGADQASVALPPAALIFSAAEPENLSAVMFRATVISPVPRIFTGCFGRTAPLATRSATVTSPPSGNRVDSLSRLTTWNVTFVGFLNPRSFGRRMCIGVWPPSKPCGTW